MERSPLIDYVHRSGDRRTLILLLPGMTGSNAQWREVASRLAALNQNVAYGPPVLAHESMPSAHPKVLEVAQAIDESIEGFDSVVLVSHSVSAFVCFELAESRPDLVRAIVAVNGALYGVARFLDRPLPALISRPSLCLTALRLFLLASVPTPKRLRKLITRSKLATRIVLGKLVPSDVIGAASAREVLADGASKPEVLSGLWVNRHHWRRFSLDPWTGLPGGFDRA